MLAGGNGGFEVHGPEMRRRGQQDDVALSDDLLIGIEADVTVLTGHLDFRRHVRLLLERLQTAIQPVGKRIPHGHETRVGIGQQRLLRRPGAAPAASYQADAQHSAAAGCLSMDGGGSKGTGHGGG